MYNLCASKAPKHQFRSKSRFFSLDATTIRRRLSNFPSASVLKSREVPKCMGGRIGPCEMLSLLWEHVDLRHGVIRVPNAKKGNTDAWREVPIGASLLPLIREWQEKESAAGIDHMVSYKGEPVTHIRHAGECDLKKAGIMRHIRPYDLRHGFATEAIPAEADYGTVTAPMGRKSPMMMLKHYQHVKKRAESGGHGTNAPHRLSGAIL